VLERIVEQQLPQLPGTDAVVDQAHEPVESGDHGQDLGLVERRRDAVEQRQRELGVLPRVGGHTVLAHPPRLFAANGRGHQPVDHDPARDQQRRFPAQVEGIAPRLAAQRIGPGERHADGPRRFGRHARIGEVLEECGLPSGCPPVAPGVVGEEFRRRRQPGGVET
jgi:hypothetical protein